MDIYYTDQPVNLPFIRARLETLGYAQARVGTYWCDEKGRDAIKICNLPMGCDHQAVNDAIDTARRRYEGMVKRESRKR
ncbi:MAG: hypothetical protein MOB07_24260 [Acidobacteria bacterium]|nr:hypothetical protein [Acidobacteriota bacterium]